MSDLALYGLLFVAVGLGWLLGKRSEASVSVNKQGPEPSKHPLQLLFDSHDDAAIDELMRNTEVSRDTLSLHLSIGRHFRNEGEVDRAILVHQNLLSHPQLSSQDLQPAIFELACDYKSAGMFDRSEALLNELLSSKEFSRRARSLLLELLERQGDWEQAVSMISRWDRRKDSLLALRLSHYHCEMAESAIDSGAFDKADTYLKAAYKAFKSSPRASLLKARTAIDHGEYLVAIRLLRKMVAENSEYVSLALPLLKECSKDSGTLEEMRHFLEEEYQRTKSTQLLLFLTGLHVEQGDRALAQKLFADHLHAKPSLKGLLRFCELHQDKPSAEAQTIREVLEQLLKEEKNFMCGNCGFHGQQFHWQCPSCRSWQSVKPVLH